ncbi:YbaK/EbsC family protein [Microbacterium sp. AZCO]|uniref:YbaK/EbsC family protein n=1 Tax=Microbacterium sp. AZCO TaxID=3142976 RepID=UPI0031F3F1F7
MPSLDFSPALDRPDLLADPVRRGLEALPPGMAATVRATPIDPSLADTAAFCEAYGVGLDEGANCIVVAGTRGDVTSYAACLVLGTTRLDVNGVVRRFLGARRASFAPMEDAVALTGMEYGGITPIGLPEEWAILVDARVAALNWAIVGAGIRGAKLSVPGAVLGALPGAEVIDGLARDIPVS